MAGQKARSAVFLPDAAVIHGFCTGREWGRCAARYHGLSFASSERSWVMLVTERMQALGDHAKGSRQPPVKERKYAKANERAVEPDAIDETLLDNGGTHESVAAVIVEDVPADIVVQENGNGGTVAEVTIGADADQAASAPSVAGEIVPQSAAASDSAAQTRAVEEDEATSAAKRALIHEWENWSALNSDQLDDPNVAEYFFRHLQQRKLHLLSFALTDEDASKVVQGWVSQRIQIG
jgi:hypothetical protein